MPTRTFAYRLAVYPLVFLLCYGGALLLKLGNFICHWQWERVYIGRFRDEVL